MRRFISFLHFQIDACTDCTSLHVELNVSEVKFPLMLYWREKGKHTVYNSTDNLQKLMSRLEGFIPHLVEIGPVGADSEFHLGPAPADGAWSVPHGQTSGAVVLFDVDIEVPRASPLPAGHQVLKGDTVCVVLFKLRAQQLGSLSGETAWCVHHHEGRTWWNHKIKKPKQLLPLNVVLSPAICWSYFLKNK